MNPNQGLITNPDTLTMPTSGLNIDQMLTNLSTQEQVSTTPSVVEQSLQPTVVEAPVSSINPTLSIDALTKPTMPSVPEAAEGQTMRRGLVLSQGIKVAGSILGTLTVLVIGAWVFSIQYPVETKELADTIFGAADSAATTVENNLQPDTLVANNSNEEQVHTVAPDNYITETPLADALDTAQGEIVADTSTEQMLDTVVGESVSGDIEPTIDSGSTPSGDVDISLPEVSKLDPKEQLLTLAQQSEQAMTALIGTNSSKQTIMRVITKRAQGLITQASVEGFVADTAFEEQVAQLQKLYDDAIAQ